jgi:hypothetical protein
MVKEAINLVSLGFSVSLARGLLEAVHPFVDG